MSVGSRNAVLAGQAAVRFVGDRGPLQKALRLAESDLKKFGQTVGKIGSALLAVGSAGIAAFLPTIQAASRLEEQLAKFRVVFAENSDAVLAFGKQLAKELGRGETQIISFLAAAQDLFVPLGFDQAAATDFSKTITRLAIDLGSFNNIASDRVFQDLTAAITGSGETMKKYGVIVNEAAVKQQLLNDNIDPQNATNQEKALARLKIILAGTVAAQGDAVRSGNSFANQLERVKGTIEDLAASIGTALLPVLSELLQSINGSVTSLRSWVANNTEAIVTAAKLTVQVVALGVALKATAAAATLLAKSITAIRSLLSLVAVGGKVKLVFLAASAAIAAFASTAPDLARKIVQPFIDSARRIAPAFQQIIGLLKSGQFNDAVRLLRLTLEREFLRIAQEFGNFGQLVLGVGIIVKDFASAVISAVGIVVKALGALVAIPVAIAEAFNFGTENLKIFEAGARAIELRLFQLNKQIEQLVTNQQKLNEPAAQPPRTELQRPLTVPETIRQFRGEQAAVSGAIGSIGKALQNEFSRYGIVGKEIQAVAGTVKTAAGDLKREFNSFLFGFRENARLQRKAQLEEIDARRASLEEQQKAIIKGITGEAAATFGGATRLAFGIGERGIEEDQLEELKAIKKELAELNNKEVGLVIAGT